MSSAFVYTAVFILSTMGGHPLPPADGETYPTYDACMLQAEADAKNMVSEWDEMEKAGKSCPFEAVEIRCEKREVRNGRSR